MYMIKIKRARNLSPFGKYPRTWNAILENIPKELIKSLSSKQIVEVINLMQSWRAKGSNQQIKEFCEHHCTKGCSWNAKIKQLEAIT